ncbi:MAG: Holliday junction branch migration protein RuvA [Anaerolineae bacterium]|nr:Holliday junction branch migration protein RuvA [Anaerolineae bacterium]
MIDFIRGTVTALGDGYLVVQVGGVGVRVLVPTSVITRADGIGREIHLHTHLAVREDALTLYGFWDAPERALFETLIGVPGIGPKLALAVLSALSPDLIRRAVVNEEPEILARVPGIGKKTAAKLAFALKDKLKVDLTMPALDLITDADADVIDALTALGYSIVEAQTAIQAIPPDAPGDIETRIRLALQYFS